ncbi:MAG: PEP-utilizing enzyme, partial [Candidatus Methanoperedens sp.]
DIDTLSPYYIINYDESGKSDIITSGNGESIKTYVYFKESPFQCDNSYINRICNTCKELEKIFNYHYLDIEFAFDTDDNLYIFQCRPIAIKNKENLSQIKLKYSLSEIYKKFGKLSSYRPNLLGDRTILGVMPDWNPAEMIGLRPRQLALSLYKELITDKIWAQQRTDYGYRNVCSHPLMITFLGIPFIDVRVDFNSFIPKNLDENIAKKLVEFYINKLDSEPNNHDKVEFNILYTCYYLNLSDRLKGLLDHGFNEEEIKKIEYSLLDLTNNILELYEKDINKIEILKEKYFNITNSNISIIEKIYWLVEDCKEYGTLPFSGVARAAFIGVTLLKSFVELNIISRSEYEIFMNSLNTVAKKLNNSLCLLSKGDITKDEFLSEYGHLRPNTYDILSWRYNENFEYYFSNISKNYYYEAEEYLFNNDQIQKINNILIENGFKVSAGDLLKFIKEAIEGREYSKFVFTKSVSEVLKLIEELGKNLEISREELAYLDIKTVLNLYSVIDQRNIRNTLISDIEKNKETYKYTKALKLPSLIRRPEEIYGFYIENEEPNFITFKKIKAHTILEEEFKNENIENKIVFIKSADPGYDYLFSKNISGLITQFGGANSHMAIRCAEIGIPAVIGAGEKKYTEWSKAAILDIDCSSKQVRIIS